MPFTHVYGPITAALQLASQAGAGQGRQEAFQNQMEADRNLHAGQAIDNSAIESSIQDSLAYDHLASQQADEQARNQQAQSQFNAQQMLDQQRVNQQGQQINNEKAYHDAQVQQQGTDQTNLNNYRDEEIKLRGENLDLKTQIANNAGNSNGTMQTMHNQELMDQEADAKRFFNTADGLSLKLKEDQVKGILKNLQSSAASAFRPGDIANYKTMMTQQQDVLDGIVKQQIAGIQKFAAARMAAAQQSQQNGGIAPNPPRTITGRPMVDPRQQQQTAQAVMTSTPTPNGGTQYAINNGGQGQVPTARTPTQQQNTQPAAPGGGGGKTLTPDVAKQYFERAGRDPAKARQMAIQDGWAIPNG